MNIRAQIYGAGDGGPHTPILEAKRPRGAKPDLLSSVPVARNESRTRNSRRGDRHGLAELPVTAVHGGETHDATLLNLSGGGAMMRAGFEPMLWDRIDLALGDTGTVEAAVIWLKDGRIGLEFAHETRLECSADEQSAVLREVIARSFPDVMREAPADPVPEPAPERADEKRGERRHPLIWSGQIHFNHDSTPVRLRNISSGGALIECAVDLPCGAEPLLDLGEAGSIFATVSWAFGDEAGLRFAQPFDLALLARARPQIAPVRWVRPSYLAPGAGTESPWAERWNRMSVGELRDELEGFIKH